ncbi:MAG TPA: hypothetical protein DCL86_05560 [Bacteroidales bacterium]|nr:hypothetical protein [Bacteroidales bacterium]
MQDDGQFYSRNCGIDLPYLKKYLVMPVYLYFYPFNLKIMRLSIISYILFFFLTTGLHPLRAQLSDGGTPASQEVREIDQPLVVTIAPPDVQGLLLQDELLMQSGDPQRIGVNLEVDYKPEHNQVWINTGKGTQYSRTLFTSKGAQGLALYFSGFNLPPGARLFVYTPGYARCIGAFTHNNNMPGGYFATGVLPGDSIILEYETPPGINEGFTIDEIMYMYRPMPGNIMDRAGDCQVNAACSEGNLWRDQINSVVRIMIKNGNSNFWCTGTLLNNTSGDFRPLLLTADHCAESQDIYATAADVARWIFYFQFQTPACEDMFITDAKSLTGAVKLASSSAQGNNGSDFYLITLNNPIPADYTPFYAGWDISGELSPSGVSIHHPGGDVKKISTYTRPLTSTQWGNIPDTHFKVKWSATQNGHGTTEGGSSGSPLFNNSGYVIGQLTGGESSCGQPEAPDYYGKIAFSWLSNGSADSSSLKPWLDPQDLGLKKLAGSFNTHQALARFKADTTFIGVGGKVHFINLSLGNPLTFYWNFEGGDPASSNQSVPPEITYHNSGAFNVKLTVANQFGADSLIREQYIKVVPGLFPNPTSGLIYAIAGQQGSALQAITISNILGQEVGRLNPPFKSATLAEIDLGFLPSGYYLITIKDTKGVTTQKVMKSPF